MDGIGILLFGIAAVALGGFTGWMEISRRSKCSVEIEAEIADVTRKHYHTGRRGSNDYYPVLKYKVDGEEHGGIADVASPRRNKYEVGKTMTIRYNPDSPDEFHVKGKVGNLKWYLVSFVAGVIFIVAYFL